MGDAVPGTPRWVKIIVGVVIVVALLAALAVLTGSGGEHGPGRHEAAASATDRLRSPAWQRG
jgi:hypothetical protein